MASISFSKAVSLIQQGELVAIATDTVYGIAADAKNPQAVQKVYDLKKRPAHNPLVIQIPSFDSLYAFTSEIPKGMMDLIQFWPGPLTLAIPVHADRVHPAIRANLLTTAFRIPNHPLTQDFLQKTGPLVVPSANFSGEDPALNRKDVEQAFGKDFPVLDGGECENQGVSTLLAYEKGGWRLLRKGKLSASLLKEVLGDQLLLEI